MRNQNANRVKAPDTAAENRSRYDTTLTAFQRENLRIIGRLQAGTSDSYGLAIKRALESRYGKDVNHGRLYPNLDTLVKEGLVEKSPIDKRTNRYELTPEGQELLVAMADALNDDLEAAGLTAGGGEAE